MTVDAEEGRISVFRDAYHVAFSHIEGLRGTGRTHRACERVADYIVRTNEDSLSVWRIPVFRWTTHIVPMLRETLQQRGVAMDAVAWDAPRLVVHYGGHRHWVEFWVASLRPQRWSGVHDVHWVYDEGECFYREYLSWLSSQIDNEPD